MLIVSPNMVAACSNCFHISLMSSSVWATIAAASANSSSRMQSSRVFVLAFSLANFNNFNNSPGVFPDLIDLMAAKISSNVGGFAMSSWTGY